jgi:hypothetical protein
MLRSQRRSIQRRTISADPAELYCPSSLKLEVSPMLLSWNVTARGIMHAR